jgi:hypothetical protein
MIQKISNYESCVLYIWTEKKELKLRSAPVSVHMVNKIITVDRNEEFISEIISTFV